MKTVFEAACVAIGLQGPVAEFRFAHPRRWKFDFCFPEHMLAVEIEGGSWKQGRHTRGKGFVADLEKYAEAACLGWTVLRVTPQMVDDGRVFNWLERIIKCKASSRTTT